MKGTAGMQRERPDPAHSEVLLTARGIVKRYPGTTALRGVDLNIYRGKVNVLIGENGAGKSTLMRILAGVESPTQGELRLDGRPIVMQSTKDATRQGIVMVHQELNMLPNLDIAENIFAGRELKNSFGIVQRNRQIIASRDALEKLGSTLAPQALLQSISLGDQQMVELARALSQQARILILDEPTSALSTVEVETLFQVIAGLKQQGVSIVYISHRLGELLRIGDAFTVLRDGCVAGTAMHSPGIEGYVDRRWLVECMTGRPLNEHVAAKSLPASSAAYLQVEHLHWERNFSDGSRRTVLHDISFCLRKGEVLGIYGLLGAGRTELLETLVGLHPTATGSVHLNAKRVPLRSPLVATRHGLLLVPEDRKQSGLMLDLSIHENIALGGWKDGARWGFPRRKQEMLRIRDLAGKLNLKAEDFTLPVRSLSGGNQQKVLLARCMLRSPAVLLLDEPTRGVDAQAKVEIYTILRQLAAEGMSIIFTSSEIEEVYALADRVLVLGRGRIQSDMEPTLASEHAVMMAASNTVPGTDAPPTTYA